MPAGTSAFEATPYLTELETTVVRSADQDGRHFVVLADTILYPEGGGQPSDRGTLDGVEVVDVQKEAREIRHYLAQPVAEGRADLVLDWERRFDHMQQHTAQHLLSVIALETFAWPTTSFHLGETRCDVELDTGAIEPSALAEIGERIVREIRAARPIRARRISSEEYRRLALRGRGLPEGHRGDVRLVEIEGIDVTTCGGTHLASTAEIENVQLGATERLRGGTRLFWIAGGRVRRRLETLELRNRQLRNLLESSGEELVSAAAAKLEGLKQARRALKRLAGELADARASALAAAPESFVEAHFEGVDGGFLQSLARGLVAQAPSKLALLTATGDAGSFFSIVAGPESDAALAELGPRVAAALDGRGGGSGTIFQGKAASLDRRAEAVALLEQA